MKDCPAYYASDSQYCPRCHMTWDANDPDPPPCKTEQEIGNMMLNRIRRDLGNEPQSGSAESAGATGVHNSPSMASISTAQSTSRRSRSSSRQ